jgi:hypothetical protein
MLEAFNEAHDTSGSSKRRKIANEIMEGVGDYLPFWFLTRFITAEISNHDALKLVAERRKFIERARNLLPSLLPLFGVVDVSNLRSRLIRIDDCCYDFPIVLRSPHEKKLRRNATDGLEKLKERIAALNAVLETVGHHVQHDFDLHMAAVSEFRSDSRQRTIGFYEDFREDLNCLSLAADIVLYKEKRGSGPLIVTDNKAKTHIVECVYSMSIRRDDPLGRDCPPLVTTPGSDFSVACSLLYELASGESNVSLAGAINRFARSDLRKRLDEDEKESRWENSDEGMIARESDNFANIRDSLTVLHQERIFWEEMLTSRNWSEVQKMQLAKRLIHIDRELERASVRHGPFLVWADQISERELAESWRKMHERDAQSLQSEIERGQRRRTGQQN